MRPLRVFVNLPFEKQMGRFPHFANWIKKHKGKFNMIQIFHGGEPYLVFTKDFFHNTTDSEVINLKSHKEEEITKEFEIRNFKRGDYDRKVEDF